jgi:hypothetical protein
MTCGTLTGCEAGHGLSISAVRISFVLMGYDMWLKWSGESVDLPSQQLDNVSGLIRHAMGNLLWKEHLGHNSLLARSLWETFAQRFASPGIFQTDMTHSCVFSSFFGSAGPGISYNHTEPLYMYQLFPQLQRHFEVISTHWRKGCNLGLLFIVETWASCIVDSHPSISCSIKTEITSL